MRRPRRGPGHAAAVAEVVAGSRSRRSSRIADDRGVQADGVADPGVLGRVRRQHQRELCRAVGDVAQPGVVDGDPGDPGAALGVGDVGGQAVAVDLLERERRGDDPPVELGDRDLGGGVQRGDALVAGLPRLARRRSGTAPAGPGCRARRRARRPTPRRLRPHRRRPGLGAAGGQHA